MHRRRFLTIAAGLSVGSIAGCTGGPDPGTPGDDTQASPTDTAPPPTGEAPQTPQACPTSQNLDVARPDQLTADTVGDYVTRYEAAYYRAVVVDYEPETRFDEYRLSVHGSPDVATDGAGFRVTVDGGGAVYRPDLLFAASVTEDPAGASVVPIGSIDDERLRDLVESAVETPDDEQDDHVRDGQEVERYADLFNELPSDGGLDEMGDSATVAVAADETTVELTAFITQLHGDYGWTAIYYVDENVVRRTGNDEVPPSEAELLECRTGG